MIAQQELPMVSGATVYGADGDKIGKASQVYLDDATGQPDWVTVSTGLFSGKDSFVPLRDARLDGDNLQVPYTKDQVKDAPRVSADEHLDVDQEAELYRYYNLDTGTAHEGYAERDAGTTPRAETTSGTDRDAMTRSEEHLRVQGESSHETGRARLRKYVTTEEESVTVPVQREEVRIEREPVTDANRDKAMSGPAITEDEAEVTLHETRPKVEKTTEPVERVRLEKETHTDQERVAAPVREEHIDVDENAGHRR